MGTATLLGHDLGQAAGLGGQAGEVVFLLAGGVTGQGLGLLGLGAFVFGGLQGGARGGEAGLGAFQLGAGVLDLRRRGRTQLGAQGPL